MKISNLDNMKGGWFIGNFDPSLFKTSYFEISVKRYNKGDYESRHCHKVATEYTVIISGRVKMNDIIYKQGDIIIMEPGESTDFLCLEDGTANVVVKVPCIYNDKYIVE